MELELSTCTFVVGNAAGRMSDGRVALDISERTRAERVARGLRPQLCAFFAIFQLRRSSTGRRLDCPYDEGTAGGKIKWQNDPHPS